MSENTAFEILATAGFCQWWEEYATAHHCIKGSYMYDRMEYLYLKYLTRRMT